MAAINAGAEAIDRPFVRLTWPLRGPVPLIPEIIPEIYSKP